MWGLFDDAAEEVFGDAAEGFGPYTDLLDACDPDALLGAFKAELLRGDYD